MSDYTADEVLKAIKYAYVEEIDTDGLDEDEIEEILDATDWTEFWYEGGEITLRGEKVQADEVDSTGGMDEGSSASITLKIGDQFFKKDGYYQSHYGYDWDGDFYEVKPVEKVVTVYERS